jgi:hypothetical protein
MPACADLRLLALNSYEINVNPTPHIVSWVVGMKVVAKVGMKN